MKAVILAGGLGTRLRPMTFSRPKVLLPVVNRPLLDRILEGLGQGGVEEAILCLGYMAHAIRDRYRDGWAFGLRIRFALEAEPLGTGGALGNARALLDGEPFLVLNGDILAAVDYAALRGAHAQGQRLGTVVVRRVPDPGRYGAVELEGPRIRRFVEKPAAGEAPSNLVNAGIYLLDPEVLDLIPPGEEVSLERQVFPELARRGGLFAEPHGGPWYDIGTLEDYLRCNREMVRVEALQGRRGVVVGEGARVGNGVIKGPAVIGDGVVIERSTVVGPYAIVGEGSTIGMGARVEGSVLFEGVRVGEHSRLHGAVVGGGAQLGSYTRLDPGVVVGDGATVREHSLLAVDVKIHPGRHVGSSILVPGGVV